MIKFEERFDGMQTKIMACSTEETKNNRDIECYYSIGRYIKKEIEDLQQELDQYKNNWEELKKYIENFPDISYASSEKVAGERLSGKLMPTTKVLNKMKELEEDK